jgi:hypothetical protein
VISSVSSPGVVSSLNQTTSTPGGQGQTMSVAQRQQDTVEISTQARKASEQTEKAGGKDGDGDGR